MFWSNLCSVQSQQVGPNETKRLLVSHKTYTSTNVVFAFIAEISSQIPNRPTKPHFCPELMSDNNRMAIILHFVWFWSRFLVFNKAPHFPPTLSTNTFFAELLHSDMSKRCFIYFQSDSVCSHKHLPAQEYCIVVILWLQCCEKVKTER